MYFSIVFMILLQDWEKYKASSKGHGPKIAGKMTSQSWNFQLCRIKSSITHLFKMSNLKKYVEL